MWVSAMKKQEVKKSHHQKPGRDTVTFMVHKDVKKHLEAGKRLFDQGEVDQALSHYKAALTIDPDCALVHFNLGFAYYESHDHEAAKRCYQRSIELQPECSLFLEHLAKLHFESEEYSQAINLFQRADGIGDIQPVSYGLWGRSYYELEQFDSAAEQLNRMLEFELSPTLNGYARYYLVLSWLRAGKLFQARKIVDPLLSLEMADYELLADLGEQLLDSRCITLAKRCFERYLEMREDATVEKSHREIVEIEERIDQILPRLFSGDEERILQNIHLLYQFGSEKVARALASIQNAQSPLVRESILEYHRRYGYPFGGQLNALLTDTVSFVREKCAEYLFFSGDDAHLEAMKRALRDSSPRVRRYAAMYLRDAGASESIALLSQALEDEEDPENQRQLRLALAAAKDRLELHRKEFSEALPEATPAELLTPVQGSSWREKMTRSLWYALLVVAGVLFTLALLSY